MSDETTTAEAPDDEKESPSIVPYDPMASPAPVAGPLPVNVAITPPPPDPSAHSIIPAAAPAIPISPLPSAPAIPMQQPAPPDEKPARVPQPPLTDLQQQNPFTVLLHREQDIHNPVARIAAKVATHIGAGLSTLDPRYAQIQDSRIKAAEEPGMEAEAAARTSSLKEDTAVKKADEARRAAGQAPIVKAIPIYDAKTGEEVGEKGYDASGQYHENMFPTVNQGPAGPQTPPARLPETATPGGAPQQPPAQSAVAGPQPARTTTIKPQEPQRAPLATPEEAAKLAPVGGEAKTFNSQIADLPGVKVADFPVNPTDSREQAEKQLANARSQSEASARKTSADREQENTTRSQQNEDLKTVQGTDPKTGRTIITNLGDARKSKLDDVLEVSPAEIATAKATLTNVNLMEQALKGLHENVGDFDAITQKDKTILQEFLNSKEMNPPGGALGYVNGALNSAATSFIQSEKAQGLTEPAKNILAHIVNMRESSLGLGKLETGGSRAMQSAIDAINKTLPGTFITNASDADHQLRMFADRLEEIKADAAIPKGKEFRPSPFENPAPQKEPERPANVPKGYVWTTKGPNGRAGWIKPPAKAE